MQLFTRTLFFKVYFKPDLKSIGMEISYFQLESSRVYSQQDSDSNFHILYSLLTAGCKEFYLDTVKQCNDLDDKFPNISKINSLFSMISIDDDMRTNIYKRIAAIIHLNVILFDENSSGLCEISASTKTHLNYAAELLHIDTTFLETSLLVRILAVNGTNIE